MGSRRRLAFAIRKESLRLTFKRRVEKHASDTDRKVAQESNQKDTLVVITDAA
jgi:hypothetical protein